MRMILAALAALLSCVADPASAAPSAPGEGFDVVRYELALTPDLANKAIAGDETIIFRSTTDDLRQLVFSSNALTIDSARLNGMPAQAVKLGEAWVFDLPEAVKRGRTATLTISYHGIPARGFSGSAASLYTSYFACDWMVCVQDSPGDKALFSLELGVPAGMTSLSIGRLTGIRRGPADTEIHSWRTSRPYSAYLFGFAIGRYAAVAIRIDGNQLRYMGDVADAVELRRQFAQTGAMIKFLSGRAGVKLPAGRYTQLVVAGDEAQEAATYSVIGKQALPQASDDPAEAWAIVHELSHQWWGNLVTCATWQDFWLNEGMATFMTAAWKEHRYGRAPYEAELDVARRRLAKARERGFDKPLAWSGKYPALGLRRAIQYSKGALFMDHLRTIMGDPAFWSGVRRFTRKHAGATVTSADFQRSMQQSSDRDLSATFDEWVYDKR